MVTSIPPRPSSVVSAAEAATASLFKPGQTVEAVVVGKTPEGLFALKIGDVVITAKLPQALPPGTTLQLQVKAASPAPQLVIVGTPQPPPVAVAVQTAPVLPLPQAAGPPASQPASMSSGPRVAPAIGSAMVPGAGSVPPTSTSQASASGVALRPTAGTPPTAPPQGQPVPPPAASRPPQVPIVESAQAVATISARIESPAPPAPPPNASQPTPAVRGSSAPVQPGAVMPTSTSVSASPTAVASPSVDVAGPAAPTTGSPPAAGGQPVAATTMRPVPQAPSGGAPLSSAIPTLPADVPEAAASSPLLVAQGATRPAATPSDLPRPGAVTTASVAQPPAPATPSAALTQMVPEALARQNSLAPLLASLAAAVAKPGMLPEPVLRAALQVLGQRVQVPASGPTAQLIEAAVAKSGVYLEAGLARGTPASDVKSGLVGLKSALVAFLGGSPSPVAPARQAAPPLRGMSPRVERLDPLPLPDTPREAARALHGQTDAALSRVKLMQLASLPDGDQVRPAAPELRLEVPFLIGQELAMAQFQVFRDGARRQTDGKRGWTLRFALHSAASGEVGAEVGLLGRSVNVALWAADPEMAAGLEAALPELAPALAAIGLEPGAVRVRPLPPETPRPAAGQYLDSRR